MSDQLADPQHWRDRAKETRDRAAAVKDEVMRRQMFAVADAYDRIAELNEQREKTGREK